ncbi:MAG: heme-copper oxidase subunit III [Deltaproteobacteria bacterium]|nr:heme-copper oxidase subunit III [Deltaproteobacteria bacterium]
MSAGVAKVPGEQFERFAPVRNLKMGMWLYLGSDAMWFGGLIGAYFLIRYTHIPLPEALGAEFFTETANWSALKFNWPIPHYVLGITLTSIMTFILICSSVSMVLSIAAIQRGDQAGLVRWLWVTVGGGIFFLGCQVYEYAHLIGEGITLTNHLFGSTFYALTGFHGMHVFSGVVYLIVITLRAMSGKFTEDNYQAVEVAGLFWHFVDLVWILVFTFVYLI